MKYKRVQAVSNMMIDYQSAKLLKYVQDKNEIIIVYETIMDYFEKARVKDAEDIDFEMPNVSAVAQDAIIGMLGSIDEGIEKFWKMVNRNQKVRKCDDDEGLTTGDDRSAIGDHRSTTGQPLVVLGRPNKSNVMKTENRNEENENSQYNTESSLNRTKGYCMNKLLQSDRADEYKRAIKAMNNCGFEITDSVAESVAYKMDEFSVSDQDIFDALAICRKTGKMKIDYFFAVVNNTIAGWNNSANQ